MKPSPPKHLGRAGRALFTRVAADLHPSLEFDEGDLQTLERAAVVADLIEELREDLRDRGRVVPGSTGRPMLNPAIDKIARLELQVTKMVRTIRLEPEAPKTRTLNRRQRNLIRDVSAGR